VDAVLNSTSNGALDATLNNITFDVILVDTLGTMLNVTLDATFLSYFESYFGPYFERIRLFPLAILTQLMLAPESSNVTSNGMATYRNRSPEYHERGSHMQNFCTVKLNSL